MHYKYCTVYPAYNFGFYVLATISMAALLVMPYLTYSAGNAISDVLGLDAQALEGLKPIPDLTQPLLLIKSKDGTAKDPTQIKIVCDIKAKHPQFLEVAGGIAKGIELLYKTFWVFNVCYPTQLNHFYSFLDLLFEMQEVKAVKSTKKKKLTTLHSAKLLYQSLLQE